MGGQIISRKISCDLNPLYSDKTQQRQYESRRFILESFRLYVLNFSYRGWDGAMAGMEIVYTANEVYGDPYKQLKNKTNK